MAVHVKSCGGGGLSSADVTASSAQVLAGYTALTTDSNDEAMSGTIATKTATDMTVSENTVTAPSGYYASDTSKSVPVSTLDNSIISGQAVEEATGDYAWKSTVQVPAGYHNAQTLEKTFSEVFPAPATPGTSGDVLLGKQFYDKDGKVVTGTMTNNSAVSATITAQGGTYTVPAGYHNGSGVVTANITAGSYGTISASKGTVSNYSISVTPSIAAGTAGYSSMAAASGDAVTVSASELVSGSETKTANGTYDVTNLASLVVSVPVYDYSLFDPLCFTANTAGSTIGLGLPGWYESIWSGKYSIDNGQTWTSFSAPGYDYQTFTLANVGDTIMFIGSYTGNPSYSEAAIQFEMTGSISASGNIMSLCSGDNFVSAKTIPVNYCFSRLFNGCTSLTTAPELPATTLAKGCYSRTFCGCTSLTTPPVLPALTLAEGCYSQMFYGCTSLTTAPELPATTLAKSCYGNVGTPGEGMFCGCTSLTTPPALPATNLADECYACMFYDCTSLTSVPVLPANILYYRCYYFMFGNCTSLTTAPELPATALAESCYEAMFYRCSSLTTPPALPATTLASSCYYSMFSACSSLTTAPALPATTLATQCYYYMFSSCSSLTTPPALPATTLADSCYGSMFNGCTSLIVSDTSGTGYTNAWTIPSSGTFTNTYLQDYMFYSCKKGSGRSSYDMAGASGNSYTYYTQNTPVS